MTLKSIFNPSKKFTVRSAGVLQSRHAICCTGDLPVTDGPEGEENIKPESTSGTVCAFCKTDYKYPLDRLSVYPICPTCKVELDKKIFPLWVKLFFAGVIVLVIFSVIWNWRFFESYSDFKNGMKAAYQEKDAPRAASLLTKASKEVPEAHDLASMANYFTGIDLLTKDRSTEALTAFNKCDGLPPEMHLNQLVLQAEIGSGYDKGDYKLFLTASKAFLALDTTQSQSWAGVASAYACLYAQSNQDSLKRLSLQYFHKAKSMDDTSAAAKEFYGRILYRLDTRQIIKKDEYDKKFPNGYTSNSLK